VSGEVRQSWLSDPCADPDDPDHEMDAPLPIAVMVEIDGVPGIESGRWATAFPLGVVTLNDALNDGGAETLGEGAEEDEGDLDEDEGEEDDEDVDTGEHRAGMRSGTRRHAGATDDE